MVERFAVALSSVTDSLRPTVDSSSVAGNLPQPVDPLSPNLSAPPRADAPADVVPPADVAPPASVVVHREQCGSLAELAARKRLAASFGLADTQEIDPIAPRPGPTPPPLPRSRPPAIRSSVSRASSATGARSSSAAVARSSPAQLKTALPGQQGQGPPRLPVVRELIGIDVCKAKPHRRGLRQIVRFMPSWVTSLAVHLCLITVLNSYVIYVGVRNSYGPMKLPTGFSAVMSDSGSKTELTTFSIAQPGETLDDMALPPLPQADNPFAALAWREPQHGRPIELERPGESPAVPAQGIPPGGRAPVPSGHEAGNPNVTTRSVPAVDQVPSPAEGLPPKPPIDEAAADDIVNRFIQFDIGKLQGEEGARALREFESLGPKSIPSLVRGLNRAAGIAGTCPVMMLSQRLNFALSQTDDPDSLRYALENIGRGVPQHAAHRGRIMSLRQQLLNREKVRLAHELQEQGLSSSDAVLGRMATLFSSTSEGLRKALGDSNSALRQVAAQQIDKRAGDLTADEKRLLAPPLIHLLRDKRADTAAAAHSALCAISDGEDFGPAAGASAAAVAEAVRAWTNHWAVGSTATDERAAKSLLALAKLLAERGRKDAAIQRYQDICQRFPQSNAATQAERELQALEEPAK